MSETVKIKSFSNGIRLELDDTVDFEKIIEDISAKFSAGRNFFGKVSVALEITGRDVTDAEEIRILDTIAASSDVDIICVVGHDEEKDRTFVKVLQQIEKRFAGTGLCNLYRGTLKNNDVINLEGDVVIMGDVNPGCVVAVTGNIVVLGGLYGEAYAGSDENEDAYVIALEMEPEKLKIGDFKYKSKDKKSKWGIHPKIQPKIAYKKDDRVIVENYTKELLADLV